LKDKFSYEVKDFKPTIRKKPLTKKKVIATFFVCLLFIGGIAGLIYHRHEKQKGDWDTA